MYTYVVFRYMWPILRSLKQPAAGGGDPHVLDMAPIYQTAVRRLREAAEVPRQLTTGEFKIFPGHPKLYGDVEAVGCAGRARKGTRRGERARINMKRIREASKSDEKVLTLLRAMLSAIADMLHEHTSEFQAVVVSSLTSQ